MNPVNWFEIPVVDMKRARAFYSKVLGREMMDMPSPMPETEMAAFPWEMGAANATGALVKSAQLEPSTTATTVYFQCDDLDAAIGRVPDAGGKVVLPKTPIGEHGFIAHVLDTEGNRVGLHGAPKG